MTTDQKAKIIGLLGDAAMGCTVLASFPYAFGDVADILPPEMKKYVAMIGLIGAVSGKFIQKLIEIFSK